MKKLKVIFFTACMAALVPAAAQKTTHPYQQFWGAYFNQARLSDRWGLWADVHLRTKDDLVNDLSTTIARLGLMYYVNDATKLTAGYAYVTHYPMEAGTTVRQPEHRPWQQVQWHTNYRKTRMMQYIRLEERYRRNLANGGTALANSYSFSFRLRYNLWYEIPFYKTATQPGRWSFVVNDEVHVNFGKQVVNNYFDQNRLFLGFKFNTNSRDNIQFGYMNQFQQLPAGNRYRNVDAFRVYYSQNLDLRKKKP